MHSVVDLFYRFRNQLRRKIHYLQLIEQDLEKSDSEKTFYVDAVEKILNDLGAFKKFRRVYDYREILEHVDYTTGKKYFKEIKNADEAFLQHLTDFKRNDLVGLPRQYKYGSIGLISPTTLRYINVALELNCLFGSHLARIVEIGGGYGGQASILAKLNYYEEYEIYDLPEVQELARRYLATQDIGNVTFPKLNSPIDRKIDLVISNYAFSELSREQQTNYMTEILVKSERGYLIMNSGRENRSGRSNGKFSLDEIQAHLPYLKVREEIPKTGPDNYVIVWSRASKKG